MPSSVLSAILAAAYAMLSVALPAPALASTTSVPASWIREVRALRSVSLKVTEGTVYSTMQDIIPLSVYTSCRLGRTPAKAAMQLLLTY